MKKRILLFGLTMLMSMASMFAQGQTCEVILLVNYPERGTVYGSGLYQYGDSVVIHAMPDTCCCYTFVNWTEDGNVISTEMSFSFTVIGPRTFVANFGGKDNDVVLLTNPPDLCPSLISGAGSYPCATVATVSAIDGECYEFIDWTEDGSSISTDHVYSFVATRDVTITANYAALNPQNYSVAVSANPLEGGMVVGGGEFPCETTATVIATANPRYSFVNWTQDGVEVSTDTVYTFCPAEDMELIANFQIKTYNYDIIVLVNPSEAGMATGSGPYLYGDNATLSATANSGYDFVNWIEDGVEVFTDANYTFTVTQNRTLVANFETYDITLSANLPNGGAVSGEGNFRPGIPATVTAIPNSGYNFVNWTKENRAVVSSDPVYTFITEIGDMNLIANFERPAEIGDMTTAVGIKIYPNPTENQLRIKTEKLKVESIEIFDVLGRMAFNHSRFFKGGELTLNISHLPTGVYFVRIRAENGVLTQKIVKQ